MLSSTKFTKFGIILCSKGCLIRPRPYKLLNRLVYRNMFKNTCFYGYSEHVNFVGQSSFLASPSLLRKELTHESNCLSSRNLINQTLCLSTRVRGSYGALFRRWCYFIRNGRNPFGNPEHLTQVLIWYINVYAYTVCVYINYSITLTTFYEIVDSHFKFSLIPKQWLTTLMKFIHPNRIRCIQINDIYI